MVEEDIWYPDEKFVEKTHDLMLKKYGGHPGFNVGIEVYKHILDEIKTAKGIYHKAAILLRKLATIQIFQNGHHRTAFEVTKTFLEMNDAKIKTQNKKEIIRFIKYILYYNIDEIEAWIRNGEVPQKSRENSSKKH